MSRQVSPSIPSILSIKSQRALLFFLCCSYSRVCSSMACSSISRSALCTLRSARMPLFSEIYKKICRGIVKEALESGKGVISYQVIQEFCNAALKKFKAPMTPSDCSSFITGYLFPLCSVFPGIELSSSALEISESTQYSFYDSL